MAILLKETTKEASINQVVYRPNVSLPDFPPVLKSYTFEVKQSLFLQVFSRFILILRATFQSKGLSP